MTTISSFDEALLTEFMSSTSPFVKEKDVREND